MDECNSFDCIYELHNFLFIHLLFFAEIPQDIVHLVNLEKLNLFNNHIEVRIILSLILGSFITISNLTGH